MKLRLDIDLTENEIKELSNKPRGYLREYPQNKWKMSEYKEAAKLAMEQLIKEFLEDRRKSGLSIWLK